LEAGTTGGEFVVLARFLEKRCRNSAETVQFFAVKPINAGVYEFIGL
jgi:hypothetical protein